MNFRKKPWLFICVLICSFVPFSGQAQDVEKAFQPITVVTDDNYPPFIFLDSNGSIQGILVDEWKLWEKKTGLKVNLIAMDWNKAQGLLLKGQADVIDTLFFTEERAKQYDFTKPYTMIEVPVFFHKSLSGIADIASLQGFTVGVKAGDACIEILNKGGVTGLQEYNSYESIIQAAVEGKIKVFSIDKPPALYYLYKMNFENEFRHAFNLYTGEFHRAVKKGRTELLRIVEDGFALISEREHDTINKKWMGEPLVRPEYLRYVLFFFLFAGSLFLVLLFFNVALRKKIRSKTSELQDLVIQLQLSEAKYRELAGSLPQVVFETDVTGKLTFVNQNAFDLFGYSEEDFDKGLNALQMIVPDDHERAMINIEKILNGAILGGEEYTALRKNGTTFPVVIHSNRSMGDNKPIGLKGLIIDLSDKLKLEARFQQAQKMEAIGTLAGGIAHDFNNLLMGIQGRASLMSVELEPSHSHSEHITAIEDYIRSATDLTKQLLGFARGGKYEVKPADINELVSSSANMFGRTKKEIHIHTRLHKPPPVVAIDLNQIEQVLLNLYVNAWQAMAGGGELYLETKTVVLDDAYCKPYHVKTGGYAKISVTDTGIGMDAAVRQQIFDPFFSTKGKGRGTGLGLASTYGIIKNHGGIITVYSEVGHGTTFNIYLPLSDKKAYRERPVERRFIKGSETVLLVDDEKMILEVGQAMLEKLGYRVVVAEGGEQAVGTIRQKGAKVDLVILDLIMPGMDGGKVFDSIREIRPQMPVMLSSGYAINGQADEIMQRGCNGFIQKPFNISELSQKVRKILDGAKNSMQG